MQAKMRIHLIHWQKEESERCGTLLGQLGHEVDRSVPEGPQFFKALRSDPPELMIIDLSRLPSQGRDMAVSLRSQKATQNIPIIFIEGDPEKAAKIKQVLPDALYTQWDRIEPAIKEMIQNPPETFRRDSSFSAYADAPLLKKLTIKKSMRICLVNAPDSLIPLLGDLPENVAFFHTLEPTCQLILWFAEGLDELETDLGRLADVCKDNGARMWVCWKKQNKNKAGGLTERIVRNKGLSVGLVDYKICSIDAAWSGLLFSWRGFA